MSIEYQKAELKVEWRCTRCNHVWATFLDEMRIDVPDECPRCEKMVRRLNVVIQMIRE